MTPAVDSRIARIAIAVVALLVIAIVALPSARHRNLVGSYERMRTLALTTTWQIAAKTQRCPRPPLRAPTTGDATAILARMIDPQSPLVDCMRRLVDVDKDMHEPCDKGPCPMIPLAALEPHPDVVAACAPLFAAIEQVAHATAACSPERFDNQNRPLTFGAMSVPRAVRLRIAPLIARGELGTAARHVTDAMRYADDYGRATPTIGVMISLAMTRQLVDTLEELLLDPHLTADDARAIGRDLDVLRATMPPADDMVRHELAWTALLIAGEAITGESVTGDLHQDRTLWVLSTERWLARYEHACRGAALRDCIERMAAAERWTRFGEPADFTPALQSELDDGSVRELIVERLADDHWLLTDIARGLASREFALTVLRMQAELRTLSTDECRDPVVRHARLAPWHDGDIQVGDAAEQAIAAPAWQRIGRRRGEPRTLACVVR